jgi:sterol desaturase/sphingolipid hydroxylase (fatty acid hydroxylase superfamily)
MDLRQLVAAYFGYPAIRAYLLVGAASVTAALLLDGDPLRMAAAAAAAIVIYPLVWYFLHRWVLHSRMLYRSPLTAAVWKRIHFDHHQDPNDLGVLFGALYTTLPTVAAVTMPVGWWIGGPAAAFAALAAGVFITCFYEYCHCIQHLAYTPKWRWVRRIKKLHLAHHFHDERGNFGITNYVFDRLLGTYYEAPRAARSATVFNLGYTEAEAKVYPWVARMTPNFSDARRSPRSPAHESEAA